MLKYQKKIRVRRETREVLRLSRSGSSQNLLFCQNCECERRFLTVDETVAKFDLTARELFRLVENDAVHFIETAQGFLLICAASLELRTKRTLDKSTFFLKDFSFSKSSCAQI